MMASDDTLATIKELFLDFSGIWSWTFTYDFELLDHNCPSPNLFTRIMLEELYREEMGKNVPGSQPLILSNHMGLMFSAVFGRENIMCLGPIYTIELNEGDMKKMLRPYNLSIFNTNALIENLRLVPFVSSTSLFEKTLCMHKLLVGEVTDVSNFRYFSIRKDEESKGRFEEATHSPLSVEHNLLENVRTGNLNYRKALSDAAMSSPGVHAKTGRPDMQAKFSVVAFITLCTRAAIEGGLPSEIAYTLSDNYTTALDSCNTINEILALSHRMYEDYILRVHRIRVGSGLTRGVRIAAEYIDLNPEKFITLEMLAGKTGYSPYYLSRIFKKEMGVTVNAYIRKARIRRGAYLLESTRMAIQDIAEALHFSSRSHFASEFSKEMGVGPSTYRSMRQNA